jgi:NADPH:quinone reductase
VRAAGINLMDTYARRGMNEAFPLPLAPGVDGAGVVIAVGGRSAASIGDRVAWEWVPGSYAEILAAPNERLIPIPESVTFEAAAAGLMQGMTAQHLCYEAVPVPNDAVVLVHSAGSGVGRMVTQLATHRGAPVGSIARGVDTTLRKRSEPFRRVASITIVPTCDRGLGTP